MNSLSKTIQSWADKLIITTKFLGVLFIICLSNIHAQNNEVFTLAADALQNGESVGLSKAGWKYKTGDNLNWANPQFDDSAWETLETTAIKPDLLKQPEWNGRGWFRLHFKVEESIADKYFALVAKQTGASEVYLDGRKLADFGDITDSDITEYDPAKLPIPFRFEKDGEHILAVRFASDAFADMSSLKAKWIMKSNVYPGFSFQIKNVDDLNQVVGQYAVYSSMRIGFFFIGVLLALALLHFLLYLFYRDERANLYYSIYAAAFGFTMLCGNFTTFGHQGTFSTAILIQFRTITFALVFVALLTFLHIAFNRKLGKLFWTLTGIWVINTLLNMILLNSFQFSGLILLVSIGLTFAFAIYILVQSLRAKHSGAWILMGGIQIFSLGMLTILVREIMNIELPRGISTLGEIALILAVPVAVSIFLARNFANTNRNLKNQLEQVEILSKQQIEQERRTAELHAENERRAKELEEARQLQLSMLPKKLPQISNIEIAAYMKPATEVGGDYYDFYVGDDGTLTVAVGDATGHGLKAGTVVTATKSLFNSLADAPDIPDTLNRMSKSLKAMNLRGLFMAMAMLKIKDGVMDLSIAGMPSVLIYHAESQEIEEIAIRATPLGGLSNFNYQQQKIKLFPGDVILLMSDGFPEMFNEQNEMLEFEEAKRVFTQTALDSPQEIINRLVKVGEDWANDRPQDDDVTFVVLKVKTDDDGNF